MDQSGGCSMHDEMASKNARIQPILVKGQNPRFTEKNKLLG